MEEVEGNDGEERVENERTVAKILLKDLSEVRILETVFNISQAEIVRFVQLAERAQASRGDDYGGLRFLFFEYIHIGFSFSS